MRRSALLLLAAAATVATACGADEPADEGPAAVEVVVDGGTEGLVGAAPVRARVQPGAEVTVRHAGAGSATHLLTSARPGSGPPVFTKVAAGALPNGAVWGACLGGRAGRSTGTCPVPPVEGPTAWDGDDYASLGAVLAGETRRLRLSPSLAPGRTLSLWCRLHPSLEVRLTVDEEGEGSGPPPAPGPPAPSTVPAGEVLVAPATTGAPGEALAFEPAVVTVRAGDSVTWRTRSVSPHTVELGASPGLEDTTPAEALPGATRSGFLSTDPGAPGGTTFRLRFPRPGRYAYACRFHPGMTGTVVVTPAGGSS